MTTTTKTRGARGYCCEPALLPHLLAELARTSVKHKIVQEPIGLGDYPRPVLVTTTVKPAGWTRLGRCNKCRSPLTLSSDGKSCATCQCCYRVVTAERCWSVLESHTPVEAVDLPGWFDAPGISTVDDLRQALREGSLTSVGPEREIVVSDALVAFRDKVREVLSA